MQYQIIPVTAFQQNCTIIWCDQTKEAAFVDPGGEPELLKKAVEKLGVKITKILLTHGHLDHVGGTAKLAEYYQVPVLGPDSADQFLFDHLPEQSMQFGLPYCEVFLPNEWLAEGLQITLGKETLDIVHCPGHTPGHLVFINKAAKLALVGDVLFNGGIGRTDFPRGNYQDLMHSIKEKLLPFGDDIAFIPGHGPMSTFGYERNHNPFLLQR